MSNDQNLKRPIAGTLWGAAMSGVGTTMVVIAVSSPDAKNWFMGLVKLGFLIGGSELVYLAIAIAIREATR